MAERHEPKLGKIIGADEIAFRDCIHVALAPMEAAVLLRPGRPFCVNEDGRAIMGLEGSVGIVDPFLMEDVRPGERFWGLIYQNTIIGMRHVWQHPAFRAKLPEVK